MAMSVNREDPTDEWLPIEEVLAKTDISRRTLYRRVSEGLVASRPKASDPRRNEYRLRDVLQLLDGHDGIPARVVHRLRGRPANPVHERPAAVLEGVDMHRKAVVLRAMGELVVAVRKAAQISERGTDPKGPWIRSTVERPAPRPLDYQPDPWVLETPLWSLGIDIFAAVWGESHPAPNTLREDVNRAITIIFGYRATQYWPPEPFWRDTVVGREFSRALLMTHHPDDLLGLTQAAVTLGWKWTRLREAILEGGVQTLYDPDRARLLLTPSALAQLGASRFALDAAKQVTREEETGTVRVFDPRWGKTMLKGGETARQENLARRGSYQRRLGVVVQERGDSSDR
jgi:hypothetical protein